MFTFHSNSSSSSISDNDIFSSISPLKKQENFGVEFNFVKRLPTTVFEDKNVTVRVETLLH